MRNFLHSLVSSISGAVQDFPHHNLPLLLAAGLGITAIASWVWWKKNQWQLCQVGTVSQLLIYPIKSCRPISVQEAECLEFGLRNGELKDRHWLVVTKDGHMVTGRQEPRIVLINVNKLGYSLCLDAPGMEKIMVSFSQPKTNKVLDCRVFSTDIQGRDCGDDVSRWLTTFFQSNQPYRLVHYEPGVMKPRKSKDREILFRDKDIIPYSNAGPVMLLSEASLEDLNKRLEKPATMLHFRPCIVVSGCEAFAEDGWHDVIVGSTRLKGVMACGRCHMTTVDPDTGVMSRKEPLETLRTFRMCDSSLRHHYKNSPLFGHYYGVEQTGKLSVGDPVYSYVKVCKD